MASLGGFSQDRWRFPALFEAATPEIYRQNAFRVLGLPVTADEQDIRKREKLLRMTKQLGVAAGREGRGYLPLNRPPDEEAIKRAVERLRDPEARLVDELFWFWSRDLGTVEDDGLRSLRDGQCNRAFAAWLEQEKEGRSDRASRHNITVLYHFTALELEHKGAAGGLSLEKRKTRATCWRRAHRRWRKLLTDEGFWDRVTARIDERGDPRLTARTASYIREDLGRALLLINARMAVGAAEDRRTKRVKRQLGIMLSSGFGEAEAYGVLAYDALLPVRQRFGPLCDSADSQARTNPKGADAAAIRLLEESAPLLRTIDAVLPADHPVRRDLHDRIAEAGLNCALAFGNETENWKRSVEILDRVSGLALGQSTRSRIEENREGAAGFLKQERLHEKLSEETGTNRCYTVTIQGQAASVPQVCACCLGPAEMEQPVSYSWEASAQRGSITFKFPLCRACKRHQEQLTEQRVLLVVLAAGSSLALSAVVAFAARGLPFAAFMLLACVISGAMLGLFSGIVRVRPLGEEHADRGRVVALQSASEIHMTFRFLNCAYAHAFAEINETSMTRSPFMKYSCDRWLLGGRSAFETIACLSLVALVGHALIFALASESAGGASQRPRPGRSAISTRSSGDTPRSRPPKAPAGRSGLALQIEQGKARLRAVERELGDMDSRLSSMKLRLAGFKNTIERYESQTRMGYRVDMAAYQRTLDSHNGLVDQHNRLLATRNAKYVSYELELGRVNRMVDRHNLGER